jgi:hypothetical protein
MSTKMVSNNKGMLVNLICQKYRAMNNNIIELKVCRNIITVKQLNIIIIL